MRSPIKYFGGKNGFANKIIEHFPEDYVKMNYIEPFCGSCAMLFHKDRSPVEVINDLDQNIYSLFKVLIDKELFSEFKELCDLTPFSEDLLKEYGKDLKSDLNLLNRAYKFFYYNRTSFNGMGGISTSGVIRRNMSKSVSDYLSSIDGLYDVHNRLSSVIIHNRDALNLIKKWDKENTFQYLDPPYVLSTRSSGGYKHDMDDNLQDIFLKTILSVKNSKLLVSGYNNDKYDILIENGWVRVDIEIKTQNNNKKGKSKLESLWKNY